MAHGETIFFDEARDDDERAKREREYIQTTLREIIERDFANKEEIERGKSGVIWDAESPFSRSNRICIKSIHSPDVSVNNLRHECIIQSEAHRRGVSTPRPLVFLDYGEGKQFSVMEYIPGVSGKQLDESGGKISAEEYKRVLPLLKKEIQRMHDEGIYHRDLHLGNIMFAEDGGVYIIDFGDAVYPAIGSEDEIYTHARLRNGKYVDDKYPRDEDIFQALSTLVRPTKVSA